MSIRGLPGLSGPGLPFQTPLKEQL
jgi:hypothetical protein